MEYIVRRTTYDKLEAHLNALAGDGWHIVPVYVGGRDWVMVCKRGDDLSDVVTAGALRGARSDLASAQVNWKSADR